ncbi:MAG: circularly permuted type 2 ATP-grasp protein [Burkholderiaceae bacterium]
MDADLQSTPTDAPRTPWQRVSALAAPSPHGHLDELTRRGEASPWPRFFEALGHEGLDELPQRSASVQRQIRDNGVTYNVYADADGPQRPWSLDLFPLIIPPAEWLAVEAGVRQRARLLDRLLADLYGPQRVLQQGLLPSAVVHGHPGYLRAMHGAQPAGGTWLRIAAFDLVHASDGPDDPGHWRVVSQRTQAPSGLGYLLENRLIISRQFPQAFASLKVQRLAATYRAMLEALKRMCPGPGPARVALLTPGPYNETYFEHASLARYRGLPLVEGSDLTVRDGRVYLKTLQGLQRVHGLLKRLDDEFLDPLELRSDSQLGVPGLLQAVRDGQVLLANVPGSALLESPALAGFLPGLCEALLGEPLALPSLDSWWCGERAAMDAALPQLHRMVIKPTDGDRRQPTVLARQLAREERDAWAGRILREPEAHTLQAYSPLSCLPTWQPGLRDPAGAIAPRPVLLRVFALCDGPGSWRVLPGGLARIAADAQGIASMQRGGSSADVWVMTQGEVDATTLLPQGQQVPAVTQRSRVVTSRAAENLFWLGRYTERTENTIRLARVTLEALNGENQDAPRLLEWLGPLAVQHGLVLPSVPPPAQSRRVFERSLIASLDDAVHLCGVGYNLRALRQCASSVRERLSQSHWQLIVQAQEEFGSHCEAMARGGDFTAVDALCALDRLGEQTSGITGAQTDRMTRDSGWLLLSAGRHIERLSFLSSAMARAVDTGALLEDAGFEGVVALFDSTITFHAHYQQRHDLAALLDLLLIDTDNPRSLAWVTDTLRRRVARLEAVPSHPNATLAPSKAPNPSTPSTAPASPASLVSLAQGLPDATRWSLATLCTPDAQGQLDALAAVLAQCQQSAWQLSDALTARYFSHSNGAGRSLGA